MTSAEREELTRLRRENRKLKEERELLSNAAAWFATEGATLVIFPLSPAVRSCFSPSERTVHCPDIILSGLPFEAEAVSRATVHDIGGVRVRLPQVEDLLNVTARP